jgi:hypothetical protein
MTIIDRKVTSDQWPKLMRKNMRKTLEGINQKEIQDEKAKVIYEVVINYLVDSKEGQDICGNTTPLVMFKLLNSGESSSPLIITVVQERFPQVMLLSAIKVRQYLMAEAQHKPMMELLRNCLLK